MAWDPCVSLSRYPAGCNRLLSFASGSPFLPAKELSENHKNGFNRQKRINHGQSALDWATTIMSTSSHATKDIYVRQAQGSKGALKEKFVEIYGAFFRGEDPSKQDPNFWNNVFLLKVNAPYLGECVQSISEQQLIDLKVRVLGILATITVLLRNIFTKRFNNFGFDVFNVLTGLDAADVVFRDLIELTDDTIRNGTTMQIRAAALRLAIVILLVLFFMSLYLRVALSNIACPRQQRYFMQHDIFPALIELISDPNTPSDLAHSAIKLLGLLANYNKYESRNPYLDHLAALQDQTVLEVRFVRCAAYLVLGKANEDIGSATNEDIGGAKYDSFSLIIHGDSAHVSRKFFRV
ncbi:hypothetical protein BC937DRAFT_89107 [Endogone sp. FLAS-F59071]|nr:hypothetical protein BC937DRAFT_89107 [Endogone sp. FLAS-F59071]|eukprot:RUS18140.1 hypothetical protein BC937DRAFT_89107 [Endogone sp. FLAS-F59071]